MKRTITSCIILVMLFVVTSQSKADMFDELLSTGPGEVQINGAWFYNSDPGSTGTGNIQPFLRIQKNRKKNTRKSLAKSTRYKADSAF